MLLLCQHVRLVEGEDRLVWGLDDGCGFSVRSLKVGLEANLEMERSYVMEWNNFVPKKVGIHAWRAEMKRIPVFFSLVRRGIPVASMVPSIYAFSVKDVLEVQRHSLLSSRKAKVFHVGTVFTPIRVFHSRHSRTTAAQRFIKPFVGPNDAKLLTHVDLRCVCWHQTKDILAFVSGRNQVTVRDYGDSGEAKDPCILMNELQREVKVLEWRPNAGKTLSVACKGGICIWTASYPGNTACVRPGVTSGTLSRGSGIRWTLVDFLKSHDNEQISALSWSPDGRYVASASYESSSFTIWDVAQGVGTPIRRGLGDISLLKWSPTGDYLFAAKFDGTFYLWETNTWTSEPWSSTSGFVTGASWDPDGRMIVFSFSDSLTLGSIHFASKPPSLDAHLLPVELPELNSLTNSGGIEKIAWDGSGERLAVSYKDGNGLYKGLIALYDIKRATLITPSLIGFIRGPGDDIKPLTFSFHHKYKQGPLLSVVSISD
ncbi:aladin-like [Bidens hawaiensis]|uniref:aladin-like n=1 Tax=Bidens hawaiensis TaxID=980011 RepID=UPI004049D338